MELWSVFPIVNFPFICRNIPAAPALHVGYKSLSWYDIPEPLPIMISLIEDCCKNNATEPGIPIGKHYFERFMVAIKRDEISVSHITTHMFRLLFSNPTLSSFMAYNPIFHMCSTTRATIEADIPHQKNIHPSLVLFLFGIVFLNLLISSVFCFLESVLLRLQYLIANLLTILHDITSCETHQKGHSLDVTDEDETEISV